jgi:hypothetical protein
MVVEHSGKKQQMAAMDIGESLVGAYLRHIVGCDVIVYNSFFVDRQGEIDVVGLQQGTPGTAWLCEVTTHIGGLLLIRGGKDVTERVIREKLSRLHDFAKMTFPDHEHRYEWWSPRVPVGKMTEGMHLIAEEWAAEGRQLSFVMNKDYTERVRALVSHARRNSSTTNEPAYRMLQILTRLRGANLQL